MNVSIVYADLREKSEVTPDSTIMKAMPIGRGCYEWQDNAIVPGNASIHAFYKKPISRPSTKCFLIFGYILVLKVS